jgi:hypothetical protein
VPLRPQGLGLAGASFAIIGAAGHAASVSGISVVAIAVEAIHGSATGIWFGGLIPLALFLRWVSAPAAPRTGTGSRSSWGCSRSYPAQGLFSGSLGPGAQFSRTVSEGKTRRP